MGVTKSESHPHFSFFLEVGLSLFFKYLLPCTETADFRSDTWLFDDSYYQ